MNHFCNFFATILHCQRLYFSDKINFSQFFFFSSQKSSSKPCFRHPDLITAEYVENVVDINNNAISRCRFSMNKNVIEEIRWCAFVRVSIVGTGIEPEVEASSVFCINHAAKLQLYHLKILGCRRCQLNLLVTSSTPDISIVAFAQNTKTS